MTKRKPSDPLLTTHQVATLLGAEPSSVIRWFDRGLLQGWRTPGGHRRIRTSSVIEYLRSKGAEVPAHLLSAEKAAPRPVPGPGSRVVEASPSDGKRRLLWVDDDASFLLGVARAMRPFEDEVETLLLDDPVEAILELASFRPDVVILDLKMPSLDGIGACRTLRRRRDLGPIQVVLATGHGSHEAKQAALAAGADAYLEKPVDLDVVLEMLGLGEGANRRAS